MKDSNLVKISIIISLVLSVVMIANTALSTYVLYTTSFTANMASENEEHLDIVIHMDTGRPTLIESIIDRVGALGSWFAGWKVASVDKTQTTLEVSISLTGSNVQSAAQVDYYIKAVDNDNAQNWDKTLIAENQSITVGGAALTADVTKDIGQHMIDIGLADEQTHTINYYIWIEATTIGAISGEPLTCTVTETLFDTITYTYEAEPVETTIYSDKTTQIIFNDFTALGNAITMSLKSTSQYNYPFIEWDINTLPALATIQSAEISLYKYYESAASRAVYVTRNTEQFTEATLDWNVWYNQGHPTYTATNKVTTAWTANGWNTYTVTDQFTDAYNDGAGAYYGCYLSSETGSTIRVAGYYTEDKGVGYRPMLVVTYQAYQASWYPVSVTDMRLTMDTAAYLAILITIGVIGIMKNKEKKK